MTNKPEFIKEMIEVGARGMHSSMNEVKLILNPKAFEEEDEGYKRELRIYTEAALKAAIRKLPTCAQQVKDKEVRCNGVGDYTFYTGMEEHPRIKQLREYAKED